MARERQQPQKTIQKFLEGIRAFPKDLRLFIANGLKDLNQLIAGGLFLYGFGLFGYQVFFYLYSGKWVKLPLLVAFIELILQQNSGVGVKPLFYYSNIPTHN